MYEEIILYLKEHKDGVHYRELAEKFLKIKNFTGPTAQMTIKGILSKDHRCRVDDDGLWHIEISSSNKTDLLKNLPLTAMFIHCDPRRKDRGILYAALWDIRSEPKLIDRALPTNPADLSPEERDALGFNQDASFDKENSFSSLSSIVSKTNNSLPVFFSLYHYNLLEEICGDHGLFLTEDIILVSELFKTANLQIPSPFTLENCLDQIGLVRSVASNAERQGKQFAEGLVELFTKLKIKGIESREELDHRSIGDVNRFFKDKNFTYEDILRVPATPGVYGFKDKSGAYIYIGKATNLKRRLMGHFRDTEESPQKPQNLREDACSFITYECGSELESLIYEHRLIRKYLPVLNKKMETNEHPTSLSPIKQYLVLLPHSQPEKLMSFWLRENQKIRMKPINTDLTENDQLESELNEFFFTERLAVDSQDIAEQEIVFRWLKSHKDCITSIPVYKFSTLTEITDAIRCFCEEIVGKRKK